MFNNGKKKIHDEALEVRKSSIGYILTALGLVAGLAWNDAITAAINALFPLDKNALWVKFAYAAIITLAVVIVATYLTKYAMKERE
jgi:thiosulfate reductase cytochrome b subunit